MPFYEQTKYSFPEKITEDKKPNSDLAVLCILGDDSDKAASKNLIDNIITKGLNLKITQYDLIAISAKDPVSIGHLISKNTTQLVLNFGIEWQHLGMKINAPKYELLRMEHASIIWVDDTATLEQNKALKVRFWNEIKDLKLEI